MAEGGGSTVPETTVAVVGAGVSGLAAGLALQRAGVPFTIFEKAEEVGGTWRDNRYPGLAIDVPSPMYTYAEHRHPGWRRWLPGGPEILDYHRELSIRTGLRDHIRFGCEVVAMDWTGSAWRVETGHGDVESFRVVVCASGFLHHPKTPAIDGLDTFAGELVHSARWRDDITTAGRRVGVIGNGSTGVQLVGALGGVAAHLTLFQRTPQWILPALDFPIPRRVRAVLARRPRAVEWTCEAIETAADVVLGGAATRDGLRRRLFGVVARAHLRAVVRDPALRARLTPSESVLCKRPVISNRFYRALRRDDVDLVDDTISHVEAGGVVTADGTHHPLDVLVLATGFEAHRYMRPIAITGEDGLTLDEAWADGPHAYRTLSLPGFPNLFMVMGPHSPLVSISIHGSAQLQAAYVVQMLEVLGREGVVSIQPTEAATARWLDFIRAGMPGTVWASGCDSWYLGAGETPVLWPYDRRTWQDMLRTPDLADHEIRTTATPPQDAPAAVPA